MYTSLKIASLLSLLAVQVQANFVNKTTLAISAKATATSATAATATGASTALNATVLNCFLTLPNNPLSAAGLSTPFLLNAPCSQTVATQQAFAEAAIYDPATGQLELHKARRMKLSCTLRPDQEQLDRMTKQKEYQTVCLIVYPSIPILIFVGN